MSSKKSLVAVSGEKFLKCVACVIPALIGLIYLALHLYDLRVAAAEANANAGMTDFYRDITQYLLLGSLSTLLWGTIVGANMLWAKARPNRAMMLIVFPLMLVGLAPFVAAAWNFYDPQPQIVLSQASFYCQWRVRWTDIVNLSLRSGSKGRKYARVEFAADRSPFTDHRLTASCEIDGLKTDYAEVYEAIHTKWQTGLSKPNAVLHDVEIGG